MLLFSKEVIVVIQNRINVYVSLIHDRIDNYKLKDTSPYNLLKSFEPTRNLINSLTASVKSLRGDKKSRDREGKGDT